MGEYAMYNGQQVKIGTCEQMYYLRADQADKVQWVRGNVNPITDAESIRFRFPFPQEDGTEPGAFEDYDYGLGLYGIEPPDDPEKIEHGHLQFTRNYPQSGGITLGIDCPRSREGKASPIKVCYNGYSGPVHIHSQRVVDGKLVLICRCGDCGALYRIPTLEDAQPILAVLDKYAKDADREAENSARHWGHAVKSQGDYYREVARRIVAGYTEPNIWTKQTTKAA